MTNEEAISKDELALKLKLMNLKYDEEKRKVDEIRIKHCDLKKENIKLIEQVEVYENQMRFGEFKTERANGYSDLVKTLKAELEAYKKLSEQVGFLDDLARSSDASDVKTDCIDLYRKSPFRLIIAADVPNVLPVSFSGVVTDEVLFEKQAKLSFP
ncbi:hypothetical protein ACOME3_003188 [Neoechinorhynchus agilis]